MSAAGSAVPPKAKADWFSRLFGFAETNYVEATKWLKTQPASPRYGQQVVIESLANGARYRAGAFSTPSLADLRKAGAGVNLPGAIRLTNELGDVAGKHVLPENRYATFQVASQFNCLEFVGPSVTPEHGITGYVNDRTQGPACSIACGAATAFRNYFAPVHGAPRGAQGQTRDRQVDNLVDVGKLIGNSGAKYYDVQGGYTLTDDKRLRLLSERMQELDKAGRVDALRAALRVGVHDDVQVTAANWGSTPVNDPEQVVTQVFGSACAVAYSRGSNTQHWKPFALMVLQASYEATLLAGLLSAQRHGGRCGSRRVFLTCLGGGVFGNRLEWILVAMARALERFQDCDLDVRVVTYAGAVDPGLLRLAETFDGSQKAPAKKPAAASSTSSVAEVAQQLKRPAAGGGPGPPAMSRSGTTQCFAPDPEEPKPPPASVSAWGHAAAGADTGRDAASQPPAKMAKSKRSSSSIDLTAKEPDADVLDDARRQGLEHVLRTLMSFEDIIAANVSGKRALAALQASGGLVHPARRDLLGIE